MNSEERLGTEKIGRLMLSMGIPTLIAQLVNLLYNIVDRIYIGHIAQIGSLALTGVGLVFPITMFISAFAALVMGGAPIAAIALGRGDKSQAKSILGNGVCILLIFSVVLGAVFFVIKRPFLYMFGASDTTYIYSDSYLSVYLIGTVFVMLSLGLNSYITAQGNSKTAMMSVVIGAVVNIILDPVFIFGFGWGVKGAALATVIAQACSALWIICFLINKRTTLRIELKYLRIQPSVVIKIFSLGVSPFIMQSTESLIYIVMNSGLQHYGGDLYVGALTVMQSVMSLVSVPIQGFTQGTQPIISYNLGAGKIDRVKKAAKITILYTTVGSAALTSLTMLFPNFFAGMFTTDSELIGLVSKVMPVFMCGMLIFGIQMGCQNVFLGIGEAKISLFIAILRKIILLIPLALILPYVMQSAYGVYIAEPVADATAAIICGCIFLVKFKKS